jgi:hypothetical protein
MKKATKFPAVESRAAKVLREAFESGRPLVYIHTSEEQRVGNVLREVGQRFSASAPTPASAIAPSTVPVWTWSLTEGMHREGVPAVAGSLDPRAALDFIAAHGEAAIFHLKDFHEPLREFPDIRRRLRDIYESCRDRRKFVVITSPVRAIPEEVDRSLMFLELRPPDLVELVEFLRAEGGPARRSALRAAAGAYFRTAVAGIDAGDAGREAAAGESQRRDRVHRRWHATR